MPKTLLSDYIEYNCVFLRKLGIPLAQEFLELRAFFNLDVNVTF